VRTELPIPSLPSLKPAKRSETCHTQESAPPASKVVRQAEGASLTHTYNFPDSDPWSSASGKQDHSANVAQTQSNGGIRNVEHATTSRTTSSLTTSDYTSSAVKSRASNDTTPTTSNNSWGIYDSAPGGGFGNADMGGVGGGGFDDENTHAASLPQRQSRAPGTAGRTSQGVEEVATVVALTEKEGMFLFQHRNYEVASTRRNSKVVRRYSDFVWLLDCLHKKYPFRQLPLLPPKRVASESSEYSGSAQHGSRLMNGNSKRESHCNGCALHRKATSRSCALCQCPCAASDSFAGAAICHVSHSPYGRCLWPPCSSGSVSGS